MEAYPQREREIERERETRIQTTTTTTRGGENERTVGSNRWIINSRCRYGEVAISEKNNAIFE